jgi:adenylate kinase
MKILIFGVQGSGKGTQSQLIAEKIGIPAVSSGDVLRDTDDSTEIGRRVRSFMNTGELVPDELMNDIILQRLSKDDTQDGFLLEGYPRNLTQAELMDEVIQFDKVIVIEISDEEGIRRLSGRRTCANKDCDAIYNINTAPKPQKEGVCDRCGSEVKQRDDDKEEAVARRMDIYHNQTKSVIEFYERKGILEKINGEKSIEDVHSEIVKKLGI